jgi:hypothetical protein
LGIEVPRSRAFSRAFNGTLLIERLLPRRNLGDGLIDRALSPLFRGRAHGGALKNFPFATLTFRARLFVAQTADLLLLFSAAPLLLLFNAAFLLLLFSAAPLLLLFSAAPLLLLFSTAPLLLLVSKMALLMPCSIVGALRRAFVAVWLFVAVWPFLACRRPPRGICLPSPRQIIGR